MIAPLLVRAEGAIFSGWLAFGYFVGEEMDDFWGGSILMLNNVIEDAHHVPGWVPLLPTLVGLAGIAAAFVMYLLRPDWPGRLARAIRPVYLFVYNKW